MRLSRITCFAVSWPWSTGRSGVAGLSKEASHCFERVDIKQDLKALQEITITERGKMPTI
jgi:hypothetical protein